MYSQEHANKNEAMKATFKYGALNGAFWMVFSVILGSFAPILLKSKGFNYSSIGTILSLSAIISIIMQPFLASLAVKAKHIPLKVFTSIVLTIILCLSVSLTFLPVGRLSAGILYVSIATLIQSLPPLLNSIAMEYVDHGIELNYGLSRGTGSISYGIIAYILGLGTVRFGAGIILPVFIALLVLTLAATLFLDIPQKIFITNTDGKNTKQAEIGQKPLFHKTKNKSNKNIIQFVFFYKSYMLFLLGVTFTFIGHVSISTYLTNVVNYAGGNDASLGTAVIIAAVFELAAMCFFGLVVKKISCSKLLVLSAFAFLTKTFLLLIASDLSLVMVSQAFQMLGYGTFCPASVYYVNSILKDEDKLRGQAFLGVATMGLGSFFANFISGRILDSAGLKPMLLFSVLASTIGFIITILGIRRNHPAFRVTKEGY